MGLEKRVLVELEEKDILDVYFHNGKLIYVNSWDEAGIRRLMKDLFPGFDQKDIVEDDGWQRVAV
jgi:hypothetical protein